MHCLSLQEERGEMLRPTNIFIICGDKEKGIDGSGFLFSSMLLYFPGSDIPWIFSIYFLYVSHAYFVGLLSFVHLLPSYLLLVTASAWENREKRGRGGGQVRRRPLLRCRGLCFAYPQPPYPSKKKKKTKQEVKINREGERERERVRERERERDRETERERERDVQR